MPLKLAWRLTLTTGLFVNSMTSDLDLSAVQQPCLIFLAQHSPNLSAHWYRLCNFRKHSCPCPTPNSCDLIVWGCGLDGIFEKIPVILCIYTPTVLDDFFWFLSSKLRLLLNYPPSLLASFFTEKIETNRREFLYPAVVSVQMYSYLGPFILCAQLVSQRHCSGL